VPGSVMVPLQVGGRWVMGLPRRGMKAYALGVAVASRGGDHLRSEPWLEFSDDEEQAVRRFGKPEVAHRLEHAGKGLLVKHYEDKAAISDGLEVCKNTFNNMELPTYDAAAELYEALTGIPMDAETLELAGERIVTVERLYNLAHGLTPADDTLPDRFTSEPLEEGGLEPGDGPPQQGQASAAGSVGSAPSLKEGGPLKMAWEKAFRTWEQNSVRATSRRRS